MKKIFFVLPLLVLMACGDDKPAEEVVTLNTKEEKLAYVLGSVNAKGLTESGDPQFDKLIKEKVIEGFKAGLNDSKNDDCKETLQKLFGPYGQDFDTTYLEAGSECLGRITASNFYAEMKKVGEMDKLNKDLLIKGFEHGMYKRDTLLSEKDHASILEDFIQGINERLAKEMSEKEKPYWDKVKAISGIQELESGVYIETIKAGKGNKPTAADDVEAHYTLTNVVGDTMETTKTSGNPLKINLTYGMGTGIIRGWTIGFPAMSKGGKYRLYVPSELAYGNGSLCFDVELLDFGPQGSMVNLQQQQMPQGGF